MENLVLEYPTSSLDSHLVGGNSQKTCLRILSGCPIKIMSFLGPYREPLEAGAGTGKLDELLAILVDAVTYSSCCKHQATPIEMEEAVPRNSFGIQAMCSQVSEE